MGTELSVRQVKHKIHNFIFFLLALDILPNDSKALFRRCQGQEKLGRLESAFRDARTLIHIEPKVSADEKIASVVLKCKTQIAFLHL